MMLALTAYSFCLFGNYMIHRKEPSELFEEDRLTMYALGGECSRRRE